MINKEQSPYNLFSGSVTTCLALIAFSHTAGPGSTTDLSNLGDIIGTGVSYESELTASSNVMEFPEVTINPVEDLVAELLSKSVETEPEISRIVNERFWEMYEEEV